MSYGGKGLVGKLPDNYRRATTGKRCGNCEYGKGGGFVCSMWRDLVLPHMVCDSWEGKR